MRSRARSTSGLACCLSGGLFSEFLYNVRVMGYRSVSHVLDGVVGVECSEPGRFGSRVVGIGRVGHPSCRVVAGCAGIRRRVPSPPGRRPALTRSAGTTS